MKQTTAPEKVEKIVAASRDLFLRQGFEKTTMEEIAKAIPISKATLYSVFQNKEEILLSICEAHCDRLDRMLILKASTTKSHFLKCFTEMLKILALSVYNEACTVETPEALVYGSSHVRGALSEKLAARRKIFQTVLDMAIKAKELPSDTNSEHLCDVMLATITPYLPPYDRHFLPLDRAQRPRLDVFTAELNLLTDILFQGMKRPKSK